MTSPYYLKFHATHPQIHLKTRKMSTHAYSFYVNIHALNVEHVGSEVQKIFISILLLALAVVDEQHCLVIDWLQAKNTLAEMNVIYVLS